MTPASLTTPELLQTSPLAISISVPAPPSVTVVAPLVATVAAPVRSVVCAPPAVLWVAKVVAPASVSPIPLARPIAPVFKITLPASTEEAAKSIAPAVMAKVSWALSVRELIASVRLTAWVIVAGVSVPIETSEPAPGRLGLDDQFEAVSQSPPAAAIHVMSVIALPYSTLPIGIRRNLSLICT